MSAIDEAIDLYAGQVQQLRQAVAGMTEQQLRARPVAGKWSTLEVVCHLGDFEIVCADRLKRIIAEVNPLLQGGDPDVFAARLAYDARDVQEELALCDVIRKQGTRILRTLTPADFDRVGTHSEAGPMNLKQMLDRINRHIPHHVTFIVEKRKSLGLSV